MARRSSTYDVIIVGSGSAGSVLAARLGEDPDLRILVVEAGPMDRSLWVLRMPAALAEPLKSERYNWNYQTEPEPFLDNRRLTYPRGRVVGGSSSINGMVYLRGNPEDYNGWARTNGLESWSYADCLPYFKRMESSALGPSPYRGGDGPLKVTIPEVGNPLFQAYIEAGKQAGLGYTEDVNGYRQQGVCRFERSTFGGVRSSAARRYLHPARLRGNIDLLTGVRVSRLLVEKGRATGIRVVENGSERAIIAEREVVLSAGAFNSPQILMLSGIGPADELRSHGIEVVEALPGVGRNLQDHLDLLVQHHCLEPVSFYPATTPLGRLKVGIEWLLFKRGVGATNIWEAGSFFRSRPEVPYPNLQHHFCPVAISYDGAEKIAGHGFQIHVSQMRPRSRGFVGLHSADPFAPPRIQFNHLEDTEDRQELRDGIRITRHLIAQKAFDPFRGPEVAPGANLTSDADLDRFARAKCETSHHPSCTCRMGLDELAVVDGEGRVHGIERLRIVDASIMPNVVTANLNATVLMMAEKLADRIAGKEPLSAEPVPVHRAGPA
ncbi:MAG: choline dehydrogenase [Hyphomicrobiaceae bacterium]